MDRSERKRLSDKKKLLRRQRKEFIADEKRSIRRQRHEEHEAKAHHRRRIRKERSLAFRNWIQKVMHELFGKRVKPVGTSLHQSEIALDRELQKEKKRIQKKRRKEFVAEERKWKKKQQLETKRQMAVMRKKINAARIEGVKKEFSQFLKHPIKTEEIDPMDKRIRKKIRKEIRQQTLRNINRTPFLFFQSISRFWQNRFERLK